MMRWKDKKEWLQGLTEDQVKESAAKYGVKNWKDRNRLLVEHVSGGF